jgi:hypothetical protein
MEAHQLAKQQEKRHDLEYFDVIQRQKEDLAREEQEKKNAIRRKMLEQKIARDQQVEEHLIAKHLAVKEKRQDYESLKKLEKDLHEAHAKDRDRARQTQKKVMANYDEQIHAKHNLTTTQLAPSKTNSSPYNDMLNSLFEEKRNYAKELDAVKERRIQVIQERLKEAGTTLSADEQRTADYIRRHELLHQETLKQQAALQA